MINIKFPKKIFNRLKSIPFGIEIYSSKKDGKYLFAGVRDKRKSNETVLYTIPQNKNLKCPNIKGFQRDEIDKLWSFLMKNREIKTNDFKELFPILYKEGGCCVAGFYGMINTLFPNYFIKFHGGIRLK
jgi:hypothetical protein